MANEWDVEGLVSDNTKVGSCYGNLVLGGPGVVGLHGSFSRTYTKVPSHNFFYLDIGVKMIGNWKNNTDTLTLFVDGNPITTFMVDEVGASDGSYSCTNTGKDMDTRLVASIAHTGSSVTLSLAWDIESENPKGSFAISDVSLVFLNLASPTTQSAALHLVDTSVTVISDYGSIAKTGCKPGYYLEGNSCLKCNEACQDCFGPDLGQCYQCAWNFNSVDGRCLECPTNCAICSENHFGLCKLCNPGYTLDFDGTCVAEDVCNSSPSIIKNNEDLDTSAFAKVCSKTCPPSHYMLWNYTCTRSCNLTERWYAGIDWCDHPCTKNQYLLEYGYCGEECPEGYTPRMEGFYGFCDLDNSTTTPQQGCSDGYIDTETDECVNTCAPENIYKENNIFYCDPNRVENSRQGCSDSSLYKYQNGSCLGDCFWPYFEEYFNQRSFCTKPCPKGYWNESSELCIEYCDAEFIREDNGVLFCDGGSSNPGSGCDLSFEYRYENGSCIESCPFPFTEEIRDQELFCMRPCPEGYFDTLKSTCVSTCDPAYIILYDTILFCERPDSHPPGCDKGWYFKYENGSCLLECPYPYDQEFYRAKSFCNKPCGEENYFTKGEACIETCDQEYIRFEDNVLFCDDPDFANSTHKCDYVWEYKFPNGSCIGYCPYPYTSRWYQKQYYCNLPCEDGQFFDTANEVCLDSCDAAYIRVIGDISMCDQFNNNSNSCPNYSDFKYHNGSCLPFCESPYRIMWDDGYLCVPDCGGNYFNTWVERCMTYCRPEYAYSEGEIVYCDEPPQTNNSNGCDFSYERRFPNGSCLMTCPSPYIGEYRDGSEFCYPPCYGNYFVESAGICVDDCEEGFSREEDSILYCERPIASNCTIDYNADGSKTTDCLVSNGVCPPGSFLFDDWSCSEVCPAEFTAYLNASCVFPCGEEAALYPDGTCGSFCRNGYSKRWEGSFRFCDEEETDESFIIRIGIYIRYEISLSDFNSYNYLAKFITKMAKLLGVRNSDIKIKSIKSGSTIIDSEVVLKSGSDSKSVASTKSKASTMNEKLSTAAESNTLGLDGVKALNHHFSVSTEDDSKIEASSSSTSAIGVGVGVAAGLTAVALVTFSIYRLKKRKNKVLRVGEEDYRVKGNAELVNIGDKGKDEEMSLAQSSIIDGTPATRPESSAASPAKVGRFGFDKTPSSPTSCQDKVEQQVDL